MVSWLSPALLTVALEDTQVQEGFTHTQTHTSTTGWSPVCSSFFQYVFLGGASAAIGQSSDLSSVTGVYGLFWEQGWVWRTSQVQDSEPERRRQGGWGLGEERGEERGGRTNSSSWREQQQWEMFVTFSGILFKEQSLLQASPTLTHTSSETC